MTTYFVSRHPGALQWMQAHGPAFDRHLLHLEEADLARLAPGDSVIGSLPVHLAPASAHKARLTGTCR